MKLNSNICIYILTRDIEGTCLIHYLELVLSGYDEIENMIRYRLIT